MFEHHAALTFVFPCWDTEELQFRVIGLITAFPRLQLLSITEGDPVQR